MQFRTKLILFLFTAILSTVGIQFYLTNSIFDKEFKKIEDNQIDDSILRVQHYLSNEIKRTSQLALDWGHWDASLQFIKDNNEGYIDENLSIDTLTNIDFDLVIYTNNKKITWATYFDSEKQEIIKLSPQEIKWIEESPLLSKRSVVKNDYSGLVFLYDKNPYILSTIGITDSDVSQTPSGVLTFATKIDDQFINKMKLHLKTDLSTDYTLKKSQPTNRTESEQTIHVETYLKSNNGLYLPINLRINRDLYNKGKETISFYRKTSSIIIALIFILVYLLIEKSLLHNLLQIITNLKSIDLNDLNNFSLNNVKTDTLEVNQLVDTTNMMLNKIKEDYSLIINRGKNESLGIMAAGVAHEINNPLAIIDGHIKIIKRKIEKNKNDDQEKILAVIDETSKTVNRITKIIQGLKMVSDATNQIAKEPVLFDSIIESLRSLERTYISDIDTEFILETQDTEEVLINCVKGQILQILINLFLNSSYATKNQSSKWIKISSFKRDSFLVIEVSDSGEKISKEIESKIMTPFFTTKDIGEATGLGLTISQKIADQHGGKLYYDSSKESTTFTLEIPIQS